MALSKATVVYIISVKDHDSLKSNLVILSDNYIVKCIQYKEELRNHRWLFTEKQTLQQATALTESVRNILIKDMRPLAMVNREGFQQMIHQFNPEYTLPCRRPSQMVDGK